MSKTLLIDEEKGDGTEITSVIPVGQANTLLSLDTHFDERFVLICRSKLPNWQIAF